MPVQFLEFTKHQLKHWKNGFLRRNPIGGSGLAWPLLLLESEFRKLFVSTLWFMNRSRRMAERYEVLCINKSDRMNPHDSVRVFEEYLKMMAPHWLDDVFAVPDKAVAGLVASDRFKEAVAKAQAAYYAAQEDKKKNPGMVGGSPAQQARVAFLEAVDAN